VAKWECETCGYIYDPEMGDPTAISSREHHLMNLIMTGSVRIASLRRIIFDSLEMKQSRRTRWPGECQTRPGQRAMVLC